MLNHCADIVNALSDTGYVIIEDCFAPDLIASLFDECRRYAQQGLMHAAKIGQRGASVQQPAIRSDQITWLDQDKSSLAQSLYLQEMAALRLALNRDLYLGLFDYEAHFTRYAAGSLYQRHLDQFRNNTVRQVSTICYLNPDWDPSFGGQLKLYAPDTPDQLIAEVYPKANTFICFLSARFPHEVCLTRQERLSLTGWFRRRG